MEKNLKKGYMYILIYIYIYLNHFAVHQNLTQCGKPTIIQLKKKKAHSSGQRAGFSLSFFFFFFSQFLVPVWRQYCTCCRSAGSRWRFAEDQQRGKEEKRCRCPHSLCLTAAPSFQSSGQKSKVSFGDFFPVCACHTALGFRTPKSKSKLENSGSKN